MNGLKFEDLKSWKRLSCLIAVFGGVFFIITTIIAMIFYPGGYDFINHYFSNLGATKTLGTRQPNPISSFLFLLSCVIAGLSLIPFWIALTTLFSGKLITKIISYIGSIFGIIACPLLMGVGIFPTDTARVEHVFSARFFFLAFAAAILIYSIAILMNDDYQNIYSFIGIIFSVFIVLFIFRVLDLINPLAQKIIVYGFVAWALIQIMKIWKIDDK
ncbi:MAG: DUF998 domain-containing protein [Promethearchaeota archaeon]|nr:MAG: DUF998 domain-containing protein [Candidatus Lokiarchaeota archaeon]